LYHYTDAKGLEAILSSNRLNPSIRAQNPADASYGDGQYLTDIAPGTKNPGKLTRALIGRPFPTSKFTHYVEIDATYLNVHHGRSGVAFVLNDGPLDLADILTGYGNAQ